MTRTGAHSATAFLTLALALACGWLDDQGADRGSILFEGGEVYTLDAVKPWAEAVVVEDGVITYVGDRNGAEPHTGSATRVVDLGGGLLLPGFIDTHAHLMMAAGASEMLQIDLELTPEEILREVEEFARKNPERPFLIGGGFGVAQFGKTGPHRRDLDRIVPDRPVVLIDDGGHSAWLNSAALDAVGIGKDTPDPIPGVHYYAREENGEPTGWLLESQTFMPALATLGAFSKETTKEGAAELFPLVSSLGVTTVFEAGMSAFEEEGYEALVEIEREGRLPFRVVGSHMIQNPAQVPSAI
jgi:predicted amidohydrolase YtcJ